MGNSRRIPRVAAVAALMGSLVAVLHGGPARAATTDQAFNPGTGALDVDYAGYLSRHDVVYNSPQTDPLLGLTVGNGRTGAMVWNGNGLTMQVSNVDASEQSAYAAGLVNLNTNPGLDTGYTTFQQRLSLYDGTLTTRYDSNRTVTVLGVPGSEVMGIHVEDSRTGLGATTLDLSMWDPATVPDSADVPDLDTWQHISTFADAGAAGFSRGQRDPGGFGYTLAATVEGAAYTTQVTGGRQVRLTITPTASYTIWFTAASRLNAPNRDSVAQARGQLTAARSAGYLTTLNDYRAFWHAFWAKSFVQYGGAAGTGDYLENVYYLATYMIAAGGYGTYPFHCSNGVFRATRDATKWSNGYWYGSQRDIYNPLLAANHVDLFATENRLYSRNAAALRAYTRTRYAIDGLWTPETMGWDGNARGTVGSDDVDDIYSTGAEAAYNMYLQYRYTDDTSYLRGTAYPFLRDVVRFYQAKLSRDPATGRYFMASSNARETYWDVRNAITDLAAVRRVFPIAIAVSTQLGLDAGLRAGWQDVLSNLEPYKVSNGVWLPHDPPPVRPHNAEDVTSQLIWPYDLTGIGASDYATALAGWNARPNPYGTVSADDAVQAARLGLGDQALAGMKLMLQRYQNSPNGMTSDINGGFAYLGVHLAATNESLLQSYDDRIRVFPAAPADAGFSGKFTLLAEDGFLVSSEREGNETKYVGLKSLYGKPARVVNPWGSEQIRVRRASDDAVLTTSTAGEVTFATAADTVYIVERTARPLTSYPHTRLTGTANTGVKTLAGTASTLGTPAAGQPALVNDTALTYDANWYRSTNRGYGDYNDDTHHSTTVGATASYTFTGTGVQLLSERFGDMGSVDVYVDNVLQATVSLGAPGARQVQQTVYTRSGLANGTHTIRIVNRSTSVGMVDALRITTGTTPPAAGSALRARVNTRYVTADAGGTGPLIATGTAVGTAEQFDVVDLGGGLIALRARVNGQFVCAENAGANPLVADRAQAGSWETFRLIRNADNSVSLQATVNGRYVAAESAGSAPLVANREAIGPWEKFDLIAA
ncbi:glycosyl hydrolase family 95 catalytic domain-containing protein [Dactylosporangium sp. CA-052675]|uniref:glycosyl hydrolase family 95 catalytic domain-containing protein n=1 Tax=Dactylosporangium sp. CA-052675 TaxID=3239927 RepID=UPI003D902FEE